jgi:hypothetical protein
MGSTLRPKEATMPVDTKKLFNEDLPGAMERNKADALAIGAKYQMNVTGAGEWFIDRGFRVTGSFVPFS